MRWITVIFAVITFLWWALQLVSLFVTPPGLHTRGSGFFSFSYASVAFANLLFTLIFFGTPSRAVRVLSFFMAFILLVDTIITLAVEKTRFEEGWVGTTSLVCKLETISQNKARCTNEIRKGRSS
jgi:hypothetical protein